MAGSRALEIDHVTIAGPNLPRMMAMFDHLELAAEEGGAHSNGVTHMGLLGFDDGSYIELISTLRPAMTSPLWHAQIEAAGGPAAWAVVVADIEREVERLAATGIPVKGPVDLDRFAPDGTRIEWQLAFPGDDPPGARLPFLIQDRTPRELRVRPSPSVRGSELTGVDSIVLAVHDLDESVELFRRSYGWPSPRYAEHPEWGARLAHVEGTPVIFSQPVDGESWLAGRLALFGNSPCAFLLRSIDPERSAARPGIASSSGGGEQWFGRPVAWFDPERLPLSEGPCSLGIIGPP